MKSRGIPLTRENYIAYNWLDMPDPWTAEHEAALPEQFRLS